MNLGQATRWIETNGDELLNARLAALLEGAPAPEPLLASIAAGQRPDGSWPFAGEPANPSSLHETCRMLQLLADLDAPEHPAAAAGRGYLSQTQSPRGFWREQQALAALQPPLWMDPESDDATIYTTALCAATLGAVENPDMLAVDQAVTWIQPQVASNGLLPGFRIHATALAVRALVAAAHRETRSVRRMVGGLGDHLSAEWDAPTLAVVIDSLGAAGFPRATRVIERALPLLSKLQRPDGAWPDEQNQPDGQLTWQIVRAARRLGVR